MFLSSSSLLLFLPFLHFSSTTLLYPFLLLVWQCCFHRLHSSFFSKFPFSVIFTNFCSFFSLSALSQPFPLSFNHIFLSNISYNHLFTNPDILSFFSLFYYCTTLFFPIIFSLFSRLFAFHLIFFSFLAILPIHSQFICF